MLSNRFLLRKTLRKKILIFIIEKIPLTKSLTNKDPFENGKKDVFDIETTDIGEPKRIKYE
jgi:hypothetical protein